MLNLKLSILKWVKGWPTIIILALMACSSYDDLKPEVGQDIADSMEQNRTFGK